MNGYVRGLTGSCCLNTKRCDRRTGLRSGASGWEMKRPDRTAVKSLAPFHLANMRQKVGDGVERSRAALCHAALSWYFKGTISQFLNVICCCCWSYTPSVIEGQTIWPLCIRGWNSRKQKERKILFFFFAFFNQGPVGHAFRSLAARCCFDKRRRALPFLSPSAMRWLQCVVYKTLCIHIIIRLLIALATFCLGDDEPYPDLSPISSAPSLLFSCFFRTMLTHTVDVMRPSASF